ncbi:hypothetical protein F5883DRAFT_63143 [Diaporthe sp. PMI_573]|nr:hypothetical protein F5883DRAFT_63143 [Diaporthaceae sp. PMI_573]
MPSPNIKNFQSKHFLWDIRQVHPWTSFSTSTIMSLSSKPFEFLPSLLSPQCHLATETDLYSIYANHYLPRLNAALAMYSERLVQLSVPSKSGIYATRDTGQTFVATIAGDDSSTAAVWGGTPSARVVGLVKSFLRFKTSMRARDGTEKVEYLRGLAHLHYMMREHQCRYGFIVTEAELVIVRNGVLDTPHFGFLEVTCCQPATDASNLTDLTSDGEERSILIAPCLALWELCMLASDEPLPEGHAPRPAVVAVKFHKIATAAEPLDITAAARHWKRELEAHRYLEHPCIANLLAFDSRLLALVIKHRDSHDLATPY